MLECMLWESQKQALGMPSHSVVRWRDLNALAFHYGHCPTT